MSGTLAGCVFPLLRIPAHADMDFLNDGSVNLWFSSEGSPIRVYKPAVAFKPKGFPLMVAFLALHIITGEEPLLMREADGKQNPTLSSLQVSTPFISGGSTTQPTSAMEARHIDTMKSPSRVWCI